MSSAAGPFFVVAALLGVAGLAKLRRPGPTAVAMRSAGLPSSTGLARVIGATELVIAVLALALGGPSTALVVAAAYVAFASVAIRLVARPAGGGCGCFGDESAPVTNLHVGLNLAAAVLAGLAALWPTDGLPALVADDPAASALLVALVAVGVALGQAAFTALPELIAVSREAESR
jgi:methylamine utilization protein MauE